MLRAASRSAVRAARPAVRTVSTAAAAAPRVAARAARSVAVPSAPLRPASASLLPALRAARTRAQSTSSSFATPAAVRSWNKLFAAAAAGGAAFALYWATQLKADACGIVAYVGNDPAVNYLLEGLHILQNRGYDSAGLATVSENGALTWTKFASVGSTSDCMDLLKNAAPDRHPTDKSGVAHTRWATHGGKTDANAHPHSDSKGRVALVHNGTIENSEKLKAEMKAKGITFKSQTDTEVIVQLIGCNLDEGQPLMEAIKNALARLHGTYGVAIIHKDTPGQVIAARNGSPLVIGVGKDRMFVASEPSAFGRHTSQFISLKDGEMAVLKADGVSLDLARIEQAAEEKIELSPAPFPHWTIKEIMDQPEAISRTLNYGARFTPDGLNVKLGGLDANADTLLPIKNLLIAACGTSYFAGQYGVKLMQALKCFETVHATDASEVTADAFPGSRAGLCVISQSGETKDTHRNLQIAENQGIPSFSVINQVGSLIARSTNTGVYLNAGREHAVASTKAFTTQVTALALIAGWFSQNRYTGEPTKDADGNIVHQQNQRREAMIQAVHRLPIYTGMALKSHEQIKGIADRLKGREHMFILGKGFAEPIAYEGALKIKEITYMHAEGFPGGALKHGPFALLEPGTPVVLIILDDQHAELMRIAAQEVRARGATTVIITDKKALAEGLGDEIITIPSNGPMTALLATLPLQLLAYEIAIKKGYNPDKPRNLAKAVTVD